jgi:membrane-associated PAP2 superfamily phosphatase
MAAALARLELHAGLEAGLVGNRQRIAGTVYGTIVVLSVVTAGAAAYEHDPWSLVVIAGITVLVFWIAHVYSHGLGESLYLGRRLGSDELASIARRESSILTAGLLPGAMIVLGAVGVFSHRTALWLAVGVGVATLTVQGVRYARLERLSRTGEILTVAINVVLGLTIVVLKGLKAH